MRRTKTAALLPGGKVRFCVEMSVRGEAADPASIVAAAQAAEQAGFALLGYTDHPAPSRKWLDSGGHPTFDPFGALCFVAAVTSNIKLMTYLAVLPYRNPLLLAKSVATVDRLSGGRFILVAGTGYLRSEFAALGRSFEARNDLFDEAVEVLRRVYTTAEFAYSGAEFEALGVAHDPLPVQLPHPPVWIGGSSRASRRRVARYGTGWAPLRTDVNFAKVVRTARLSTNEEIAAAIRDLRDLVEAAGRQPNEISVQLDGFGSIGDPSGPAIERAQELAAVGVTHLVVRPSRGPTSMVVDEMERFGSEVIAKLK
jgi:probable F420-dependent oxidoreductase